MSSTLHARAGEKPVNFHGEGQTYVLFGRSNHVCRNATFLIGYRGFHASVPLIKVTDVWDVLLRQRENQRREAEEQPDADLESSPSNTLPAALTRRREMLMRCRSLGWAASSLSSNLFSLVFGLD